MADYRLHTTKIPQECVYIRFEPRHIYWCPAPSNCPGGDVELLRKTLLLVNSNCSPGCKPYYYLFQSGPYFIPQLSLLVYCVHFIYTIPY